MTDIDLQTAIIDEIKAMCKEESLMMPVYSSDGESETLIAWDEYKVYRQDKPYKNDENEDEQDDYILVIIGDEDTDEKGNWTVEIQIVISIYLYETEHQGNLIIANLMNQIDYRFCTKGILNRKYEPELEKHKRFNDDCWPNYYEAAYITKWKIPAIHQEGLDEYL